jgi:hypothetical protein
MLKYKRIITKTHTNNGKKDPRGPLITDYAFHRMKANV